MAASFLGVKLWPSSPKKQSDRTSTNGAAPDPRGTRRKAKADPYEAIDDGELI